MELGLFTEFESPAGMSHATAFDESLAQMRAAEELGLDAVWLAEIHFQKDRSVLSSPLTVAAALAACTTRIKIGIAVQVLPLSHPLRLAEDVATVDHLSKGRLEFGIGRSGLPGHYQGFNIPYGESRERFLETLDILVKAWTQDRFSHEGKYFQFRDVCAMPKPFQRPHPPIRMAATTEETYPLVGRLGLPIFVAPRTIAISDLERFIGGYEHGRRQAGHAGRGDIGLSMPVYVAESDGRAREEAEASTMHFFRAISQALQKSETRQVAAERLGEISYADVLREQVIYGSPETVADRLLALRERIPFSSLSGWMNCGGHIPHERVLTSMRLFAERVIPRLG
ncbi:MAG TPA: LLM class flavin-dependent oxidoreductase [Candidatus Methylomirabilis sp.]|nr:LLM class flavin-dependent oxidoreductase [Candidatus Methylomirabilis sp.]